MQLLKKYFKSHYGIYIFSMYMYYLSIYQQVACPTSEKIHSII